MTVVSSLLARDRSTAGVEGMKTSDIVSSRDMTLTISSATAADRPLSVEQPDQG